MYSKISSRSRKAAASHRIPIQVYLQYASSATRLVSLWGIETRERERGCKYVSMDKEHTVLLRYVFAER